ncbi:hypothetical protein [Streptomyces xantholiticus]|uniref:hypothetical protein n=1 Tax=Streptomyces xantholiticus TaxID=68285 RepID=UPI0016786934|nr:hypothetical protein [Streptomyces xantholiticus]GGW68746.1 hypothetical protein GCM10010381_62070 [Streptomyces xantholiticus]
MGPHIRTCAVIHKAGRYTTLVSLSGWCGGVVLCPVATRTIHDVLGDLPRADWPGVELTVHVRVDATTAEDLDCVGWDIVRLTTAAVGKARQPHGDGARMWMGSQGSTVPSTQRAA